MKSIMLKLLEKIFNCEYCILYKRLKSYTDRTDGFGGDCPFCGDFTGDVVEVYEDWSVVENIAKYPRLEKHILIIPHKHKEKYSELTKKEFVGLLPIYIKYMDEGYMNFGRQFPDNGASVKHLHIHLVKK